MDNKIPKGMKMIYEGVLKKGSSIRYLSKLHMFELYGVLDSHYQASKSLINKDGLCGSKIITKEGREFVSWGDNWDDNELKPFTIIGVFNDT